MLIIKCAACKAKLMKYDKVGPGEVLRCHRKRIAKVFDGVYEKNDRLWCSCGKDIGIDKGTFFKMITKAFTYSGTKRNL